MGEGRMAEIHRASRLCLLTLMAPLWTAGVIAHIAGASWLIGIGTNASTGIYRTVNSHYCRSHGVPNSTGSSPYTIEISIQGSVPYAYSGHLCGLSDDLEHWCCETSSSDVLRTSVLWVVLEFAGTMQAGIILMGCVTWLKCVDSDGWHEDSAHRYWLLDRVLGISLAAWVVCNTSGAIGFLVSACDAVVSHDGIDTCSWGWPLVTSVVEVMVLWIGIVICCSVEVVSKCMVWCKSPTSQHRCRVVLHMNKMRETTKVAAPVHVPRLHTAGNVRVDMGDPPPPSYATAVGQGRAAPGGSGQYALPV